MNNIAVQTANDIFPQAVLFDLDGTLLDSAPDFKVTLDTMRHARDLLPLEMSALRPVVSKGGLVMLEAAFPHLSIDERKALLPEFLEIYQSLIGKHARLFDGINTLLEILERHGIIWGIITNKAEYLARLVLPQYDWEQRCKILIGGDTLAERKPHPLPLLEAAKRIGVSPQKCIYMGDDERDIMAARAAHMPSVAALWGYRLDSDNPQTWQADYLCEQPKNFFQWAKINWPLST